MANRVIPPHRRDPDDSHDSQYYRRGVDDIRNVITSTTEPLNAEPGTLWYNPEGVPDYGVDIGISKDDADQLYTSKDEFAAVADVPPRVEAVETALTGKADTAVVQAVDTRVQRVESALILDTAYPTLQDAMDAGAGGTVLVTTSQTVPAGLTIPPKTRVLVSPGVVLTRQQPSSGTWITVSEGAVLDGGEYNGNKAAATDFNRNHRGINVLANGTVQNVYMHDNNGHGVRLAGTGATAINVRSDNNGNNPGGSGTGDGVIASNNVGLRLRGIRTNGNARFGTVVTATDATTEAVVEDVIADGNGYGDIDFERVELTAGSATMTIAARDVGTNGHFAILGGVQRIDNLRAGMLKANYQAGADYRIRRLTIEPSPSSELLTLDADRLDLSDVEIRSAQAAPYIATLVARTYGKIDGMRADVPNATHGIRLQGAGWKDINDLVSPVINQDGFRRNLRVGELGDNSARTTRHPGLIFTMRDGKAIVYGTAIPSSNSDATEWTNGWTRGDMIYHAEPAAESPLGWICVASGQPGTWKAFGAIEP